MTINNTLLDNSEERFTMLNVLKECLCNPSCSVIRIATGYWDLPAICLIDKELRSFLDREGCSMKLLIGSDPIVRAYQLQNPIVDAHFPEDYIKRDINEIAVSDEYISAVRLLLDFCKDDENDSKLQIRIYKQNKDEETQFFHAKCYIFSGKGYANGIIGSSNFTKKGLIDNSELNYFESQPMVVAARPDENQPSKGHIAWFDEKWELSKPWNRVFIEEILKPSPVGGAAIKPYSEKKLTPYELYIKLLQTKFGNLVDKDLNGMIESYLPQKFDPLDYQISAVKQCYSIMKEHGGFMLADVVGLGKTIVGTLLIKHFLTLPDENGREQKVLVVTPPAIKSSWIKTIADFDKNSQDRISPFVDFITTGSIGNLVDDIDILDTEDSDIEDTDSGDFQTSIEHKNYGLILIDESHKFRNSGTAMYKTLDNLITQIGSDTGFYPYIGLLSATPQNNRPDDLKNQIYLFERNHADSTLRKANSGNIERFFSDINLKYNKLINSTENDNSTPDQRNAQLKQLSTEIRDCILSDILVRRTRTDVMKYYKDDVAKQHIVFPTISGPHALEYKMEKGLAELFAETMNLIAPKDNFQFDDSQFLCYYRYRAIEYFKDNDVKSLYVGRKNMTAERFSRQLARIMQINLVKRIESSFTAFKASLSNLRRYTQNMIDMWEHDAIFICPQIDVNKELDREKNYDKTHRLCTFEECAQDIRNKIKRLDSTGNNENGRNKEYKKADFDQSYIDLLRNDLALIERLFNRWNVYSNDPKLEVFKAELKDTLFDKNRNAPQKLVIFTEAIDTANAIKLAIETTTDNLNVLLITASNRDAMEQTIKENFDANYDGPKKDDYQVIVTTEVLAEGVNLHRANCILNYDTPWNATRLMQRIGRVNRIGSTQPVIYVYNFMPSAEGDAEIQLVKKAHVKLQSFHTLFGEDSQIFSTDEEVSSYDLNTQVNGEESPMEKFIYELKEYKMNNPARYEELLSMTDNLEMSVSNPSGENYLVVKTPYMSGLFVKVDSDLNASCISALDMYTSFKTDQNVTSGTLPDNWNEIKSRATLAVNRSLSSMTNRIKNSQKATTAKEIITMLKDRPMSKESKRLLADAFNLINRGNIDIIKTVLALEPYIRDKSNYLFDLSENELDEIISEKIRNVVANVEKKYGKAEIYIGLAK